MDIKIRPSGRQFWAENFPLWAVGVLLLISNSVPYVSHKLWMIISTVIFLLLLLYACYRWVWLRSFVWIIGQETITQRSGIVAVVTDHIELYRVIDYQENQSFHQRLLGIKNVVLVTTDKLNGIVIIKGLPTSSRLMNVIRQRVEICKTKKRIYEVTNN